ncbi:putative sporulation transcription regulator WhiA [Clostridium sp. CAG:440]|jgi:DNA-binding protein WhiA|nr:putative sporulation transcription regulator WhiA [Clostridium sp. CAG:440]HJJ15053.1 DNA-binding protein WhiA [Clostridiaceae bacterium]
MSFSSDVKEELSKVNNLANKIQVKYEFIGYLISNNSSVVGNKIRYATESQYNINRFAKLLSNLKIDYKIEMEGKSFVIKLKNSEFNEIEIIDKKLILKIQENLDEKNEKSLVKGVFLGAGSINNPDNKYHLEIRFSNQENEEIVLEILKKYNINFKKLDSQKNKSIYIKEGEEISKFLAFIGANKAVMKFEDIRVQRQMRGKVNRLVNCKAANLNKTLNASVEQIDAIRKLQQNGKFNKLEDNLKEIANLRLENPDMPLLELGKLLKNPVGKSGVNYRLKKIIEIANED